MVQSVGEPYMIHGPIHSPAPFRSYRQVAQAALFKRACERNTKGRGGGGGGMKWEKDLLHYKILVL